MSEQTERKVSQHYTSDYAPREPKQTPPARP